jgi:hypothetical protein
MKAEVNGVEIKEGQVWNCTDGNIVEVVCVRKYAKDDEVPEVVGGYIPRAHRLVTMDADDFVSLVDNNRIG